MFSETQFSTQTPSQRRKGGGVGRSIQSFNKLELIDRHLRRLLPVLKKRGKGIIIDMNAGDGKATPYPIADFFSGEKLISTPHLAIRLSQRFPLDVILCEKCCKTRQILSTGYGDRATILGNHKTLLDSPWREAIHNANWVIMISDPNGYKNQGEEIMFTIAKEQYFSDFIIVINTSSLARAGSVKSDYTPQSAGCIHSFEQHKWMLDPQEWRTRLGKRQVLATNLGRLSKAMTAEVLLVSNYIPGHQP